MFKAGDQAVMVCDPKSAAKESWRYLGHVVNVESNKHFVVWTRKEMYRVTTLDGNGDFLVIPECLIPLPPDWEKLAQSSDLKEPVPA